MSDSYHHVYSSVKGYTTLFMSKGILHLKNDLEEFSRTLAGLITEGLLMNSFKCREYRCFSKIFNAGVDSFRRKRYAIHTVILEDELIGRFPFFTPLSLGRNSFIQKGTDLSSLTEYSFPDAVLKKEMFDTKFRTLSADDISFVGAASLYSAFISASDGDVIYIILKNMKDMLRIDKILMLLPRKLRDRFNFFYNLDGERVSGQGGIIVSLQPSWENKRLEFSDSMLVNLCTGDTRNVTVADMDETITIENLWNETNREKRTENIENVKNFIQRQEINTLVK